MSTEKGGIWKWIIGWVATAIIAPVAVYHLTEGNNNSGPIINPSPSPSPTLPPIVTPTSEPSPPPPPETTSITVAYGGDFFGCNLPISISIGDQEFYPQGSAYQINGIEVGQQNYRVSGQIHCPTLGSCQVYGQGVINVIPRNTYYLGWQNTAFGQCTAVLQ